jgi:hypothetical protein
LYQKNKGIGFFNKNYKAEDEIKLYVLIDMIFGNDYKDEIETALKNGIEPRKAVLNTLKIINDGEKLPPRMPWW